MILSFLSANKVSAPTSPARTSETLAAALERSLQHDRSRAAPAMPPNAKVLLVIDNYVIDWSKYFRNASDFPIRVEQADFPELDLLCTEHSLTIEISQMGRDPSNRRLYLRCRTICPQAAFVGPSATRSQQSKTVLRALIAAGIPFINSHTSMIAFMDKNNLKKQLRKLLLADNTRIPLLPTIHYPHFHRFHQPTTFPVVICVNEGYQGIGKIKVNSQEELCDIEGMLQIMGRGDTEVEVEPFVDIKFDLHVQKIGHEIKTFLRRGISKNWKSNVGSAVLEQIPTNERFVHRLVLLRVPTIATYEEYLQAICEHVGRMSICSIDILVSKDGREYVHDINDVIALFGESQEDDRRNAAALLRAVLTPPPRLPSRPSIDRPRESRPEHPTTRTSNTVEKKSIENTESKEVKPQPTIMSQSSFADDTMGQLKRTFAGIFGDVG
ncbi:Synapsin, ATP binding domain protein [Dictyocaulus viviparus]|uniref:Synapsin, ATP binding domain protein n=1 Tax=Dictyocaulus viviparus TaxID=29172 RepID=A0A0D8Y4V4_DICVI|nr:Synapsin, ATP binding domain protein [Dictyocaulus viviparus]